MKIGLVIIIIFALIAGVNYYAASRTALVMRKICPVLPKWVYGIMFVCMVAVLVLGFARSMLPIPAGIKNALGIMNAYWMGIFVYLLIFFAIVDLIILVFRAKDSRVIIHSIAMIMALAVSFYGFYHAKQVKTIAYDVKIEKNIGSLNIAMVSDLHIGSVGGEARLPLVIDKINESKPDVVCIAGDIFDNDFDAIKNPDEVINQLKRIDAPYGIYACLGNHDAGNTIGKMLDLLEKANVKALNDEYEVVDGSFIVCGRLDGFPIGGNGGMARREIEKVLENADLSLPVIVLDHNPQDVDKYDEKTDLVLSGHTHKGQLFPFEFVTDRMFPVDYGYYRRDENAPHVVVSSGAGAWGMPMRVGTDCEVVTINMHN